MDARDKQRILDRYDARLDRFGPTSEALAVGSPERRAIRFDVLTQVGIETGDRVLDLGCGFGDLVPHLRKRGLDVDYTGIDINAAVVKVARGCNPGSCFETKDLEQDEIEAVDWVVSTSSFNLRLEHDDNYAFVERILKRCHEIARKGVAIDFLSTYVDFQSDPAAFHYDPERVFGIAKRLSKRVTLRHDYPIFEFCLYLYPDFQGWGRAAPSTAET